MLGRWQHRLFMRSVQKTAAAASALFCICEGMSRDYAAYFRRPCLTIHTPATISQPLQETKKKKISYLGNLGLYRDRQLVEIGRALKSLGLQPAHIDVYSAESRKEILSEMTEENGIVFHGPVDADEVLRIMGESLAVLHTESFDESIRQSVRYSVSTKIADSLASGTCIFAYGPEEVASISYLKQHGAAVCCTAPQMLVKQLTCLIQDYALRAQTVERALALAEQNHARGRTPEIIRKELQKQHEGLTG